MRIGYYAHHHGSGHCRQADKLAALLPDNLRQNFTVFTSLAADDYQFTAITAAQIVRLSPEDQLVDDVLPGRAGQHWQPESLHYSPVGNANIQTRSWQILDGIQTHNIDIMIIDVSVEVAMLCRVASTPYLYVRLAGIRDDTPHLTAFAGALGLLAPYPEALEAAKTADWLKQKTLYLDFLPSYSNDSPSYTEFLKTLVSFADTAKTASRLERLISLDCTNKDHTHSKVSNSDLANTKDTKPDIITVIKGYGGHQAIDAKLFNLREIQPDALIISLGPIADDKLVYVDIATQVPDVTPFIKHSDLLIMACGLNAIAQVYALQTPLVVLPDQRPHQEQQVMAEALIAQGRAVSWDKFTQLSKNSKHNKKHGNIASVLAVNHGNNCHLLIDNQDDNGLSVAQLFMSSLAKYHSTKLWFEQWLLPKLKLRVEC